MRQSRRSQQVGRVPVDDGASLLAALADLAEVGALDLTEAETVDLQAVRDALDRVLAERE